jgi:YgiT-type zinc finger domain-containing protein
MRLTNEPIVEEYKGVSIAAKGIEHYVCDACGEYELGPNAASELSRQLVEGYAQAAHQAMPPSSPEAG